ncbi:MAG TPA: phosphoglucosamine mutase [Armatimonadota bacterium]|nr:phosphoglucosamine mutase [Armatimonadota bacterium]
MELVFGTDGVRGIANIELTAELVLSLGRAAGSVIGEGSAPPRVVVGTDTRISSDMLEAALCAGLQSAGANVLRCGVMPTPAVAALVLLLKADAGAVVSASHNPAEYNGIKFFSREGYKLPDEVEERIEHCVDGRGITMKLTGPITGRSETVLDSADRYLDHTIRTAPVDLAGVKLVVDCANGAAVRVAPDLFRRLNAEVIVINAQPDGLNINRGCGALHPEMMQHAVLEHGAFAGMSFDGDADRVLMADEKGKLLDGDRMMLLAARQLKAEDRLDNNLVVGTVMSNMGFEIALRGVGITLARAPVGDRYVLEEMKKRGAVLGGEQSGHVIFLNHTTTGDGLVTALQTLAIASSQGSPLSSLTSDMVEFPQLLENVRVSGRDRWRASAPFTEAVERSEARLGAEGRVLIRPSGTEPLLRVMVEGPDARLVREIADELAALAHRYLGD